MKIFLFLAGFLLAAIPFEVSAGSLNDAEVSPAGKYQDSNSMYNLTLTWDKDVEYVNPVTENGAEGVKVNINAAGHEVTVLMSYKKEFDWNTYEQYELKNVITGSIFNAIMDPTTYQPYKGKYIITVPEGIVKDADGNTNSEQLIEYEVMSSAYNTGVTPAQYQTYNSKSLKEVTVTFNGTLERIEPIKNISVSGLAQPLPEESVTIRDNAIILDLSDIPAGSQNITIPTAYVMITDGNGEKYINSAVSLSYTIWNGMDKGTFISPKYSDVGSLETPVEATWNYQTVTASEFNFYVTITSYMSDINEDVPAAALQLVTVDPEESNNIAKSGDDTQTGNVLRIDLSSYADRIKSGSMVNIDIPAGCVEGEDGPNPAQTLMFTYYAPIPAEAEISDENGIISITWPEITGLRTANGPTLSLEGPDDFKEDLSWYNSYSNPDGIAQISPDESGNPNRTVKIDLSKLDLNDGDYTLIVPGCSLLIFSTDNKSYSNAATEYKFEINKGGGSSVENALSSEQNSYRVYTSQGIHVLTTENMEDIKSLPSGLYIVNGKKILIK